MASSSLIRPASRADLPALVELEREVFSDPWTAAQLSAALGWTGALALIAELSGDVVGYVLSRNVVDEGEILSLGVRTAAQRQGIGRALLDAAIQEFVARNVRQVWLEVRESNDAARAMYERAGFVTAGRRRGYYKHPEEDALVLHRMITDA